MPTTIWTGSTTTVGAGCELRYVATLQESCTDGPKLIRPSKTGCGPKRISPLTFPQARNIWRLTGTTHFSATIAYLRGMRLCCGRWKWRDCERVTWILIIPFEYGNHAQLCTREFH